MVGFNWCLFQLVLLIYFTSFILSFQKDTPEEGEDNKNFKRKVFAEDPSEIFDGNVKQEHAK